MILNRVKEGVHGFAADALLAKNIRGAQFIDMGAADCVLTKEQVMAPFKLFYNVGDGLRTVTFPAEFDNYCPTNQYVLALSDTAGLYISSESSGPVKFLLGGSQISFIAGVGFSINSDFYARYDNSVHGGINNFDGDLTLAFSDLGKTHVYEGVSGTDVVTLDGALLWPFNAKIMLANVSFVTLNISGVNGANIVGLGHVAPTEKVELLRQAATNNWYRV